MLPILYLDVSVPGSIFLSVGMGLVALCLLTLLVSLVESVVMTLLRWNSFQRSLVAAGIMNIVSSLVGGVLLIFLQEIPVLWIITALFLSVGIEGTILKNIQPAAGRRTWLISLCANIASYLLLILPAYFFSLADRY